MLIGSGYDNIENNPLCRGMGTLETTACSFGTSPLIRDSMKINTLCLYLGGTYLMFYT